MGEGKVPDRKEMKALQPKRRGYDPIVVSRLDHKKIPLHYSRAIS